MASFLSKEEADTWNDLKQQERDLVVQQEATDHADEKETTKKLFQNILETALDYVTEKEHVEEEHIKHSRESLEHALEEESVLEEFAKEDQLKDIPMDTFLEDRLRAAQAEEREAMKEEEAALEAFDELKQSEENIKATLEELKNMEP